MKASLVFACVLLLMLSACSRSADVPDAESAQRQSLLAGMIGSPDPRALSGALRTFGPIENRDVAFLADKAGASSGQSRRNAIDLLALAPIDASRAPLRKLAGESDDIYVYAVALGRLLEDAPDATLAAARPDMLQKALASDDATIVVAGLKAGALARPPNIDAEFDRRLSGSDTKMRDAVLVALADAHDAGPLEPKLKELISHRPTDLYVLTPIFQALSKSNDPAMADFFRQSMADKAINGDLPSGISLGKSRQPWLRTLLLEWLHSPDIIVQKHGFQILSDWDDAAIRRELVQRCVAYLESAPPSGDTGQRRYLVDGDFYRRYLSTLAGRDEIYGVDDSDITAALTFAHRWLAAQPKPA